MPFVGTVMLEHHCANKRKNIKNTSWRTAPAVRIRNFEFLLRQAAEPSGELEIVR